MTTSAQSRQALACANEVRVARAELRRRLARGEVAAASVIVECPPEASSWSVGGVIASQRQWGVKRCRKLLSRLHIAETKPLRDLTDRQRRMLANQLAGEGQ